jgi:hypothetical protein
MANDLVTPAELAPFAGGKLYDELTVDSAVESVRHRLGWHVAPRATRTVRLDGPRTQRVALPTLDPEAQVTAVRDVSSDTPVVLTGWRKLSKPMLYRELGWPCGIENIEVDLLDGFATCPMDLRPLIAQACAEVGSGATGVLKSFRIDDYTETREIGAAAAALASPTQAWPYQIPRKTTA